MSKFFVGCMARVVAAEDSFAKALIGEPVRIVVSGRNFRKEEVWGIDKKSPGGLTIAFRDFELEPILPSGHRTGDYSYTELMDRLKAGEVECV